MSPGTSCRACWPDPHALPRTGDDPDTDPLGTQPPELSCDGIGRRPGGEDVVDHDDRKAFQGTPRPGPEGPPHILLTCLPSQVGLGRCLMDPFDQIASDRESDAPLEESGEELRLVELTLPLPGGMEGHGHEQIPVSRRQSRTCRTDEEAPQERSEPDGTIILEPMDDPPDQPLGQHRGADRLEREVGIPTVATLKGSGDRPIEWESTAMAERGPYRFDLPPAPGTDPAQSGHRTLGVADLADRRVGQRQDSLAPAQEPWPEPPSTPPRRNGMQGHFSET